MPRIVVCLLLALCLAACGSKEERRDSFFRNGLKMEQEGRRAEARIDAKNVIKLDPNHVGAQLLLARCALKDQNWREAYAGYQRAVELEPQNIEALLGVGQLHLLSGDTAKAEEAAAQVLALDPESVDGRLLRVGAMLRAKRFDEASRQLDEIFVRDPANEDAFLALSVLQAEQGRVQEALAAVRAGLEAKPESRTLTFRAASLAADSGDYRLAESFLLQLKSLEPANSGVTLLLASLYERMGEPAQVEGILRDLLTADPDSEDARLRLAEYMLRGGKASDAKALLLAAPQGQTPKLRLAVAAVEAAAGNMAAAEQVLTEVAGDPAAGPAGVDARLRLSEIRLRKGDRDGALGEVDAALLLNPADARGRAARGRILMSLGRHEEAVGEFRIAIKDVPDDAGVAILLARAHFAMGNALSGLEGLKMFLSRKPDTVAVRLELAAHYERQGQQAEALRVLGDGVRDGIPPELLLAMGEVEARQERYTEAVVYFHQASAVATAKVPALLRLGAVHAARKEWPEAKAVYEEVLAVNPDEHGGAEGLVAMEFAAGHAAAAVSWARNRAEVRPADPAAADLWGRAAMRAGDVREAEAAFRQAQARAPEWSAPSVRLASLYAASGQLPAAIDVSRTALQANPDSVAEALLLGQLLQQSGHDEEPEAIYRRLLAKHPDLRPAANNLAYLLVSRTEVSAAGLQEALTLATMASAAGDPTALDTLGWIQYRLGDRKAALDNLRSAHQALPEDPAVTYHLAQVLADEGQQVEAKNLLTRMLAASPDFPEQAAAQALLDRL